MKLSIDTDNLQTLAKKADQIVFTPEGEETLIKLLELEGKVKEAISLAKQTIEASAKKLDENFTSVQGDKVKVSYRSYGTRYIIDEAFIKDLPKELYRISVKHYPNSKEISKLATETGKLPQGIVEPDRQKQITISIKK